jgi:hypothetical protein
MPWDDNIEAWDSLVPSVLAVAMPDSSLTYLPVVVDPSWNMTEYKKVYHHKQWQLNKQMKLRSESKVNTTCSFPHTEQI